MKNRQTLSAVLLTALIAGLAYVGISRGPVARQASPAGLALGQAPTTPPARLAKPPAVALPVPVAANDPFPFRLKNTDAPIGELVRNETAVLLRNAFIDTALGSGLAIPAEFKTTGDPLTYVAQARGPATAAFRRHIAASGGKIISYIPNNAYLVRVDADGAARLANWSGTQSVLPFEPYYKLEMKLLEMAVTGQPLPEGALINVVLFPNSEPAAAKRLAKLGVEVLSQDRTPFGAKLVARVPADKLAALARLTEVQGLERHRPRRLANDLTRPRLGVEVFTAETAADGTVTNVESEDHLELTGNRIYVNVNDTGVDGSHAAFGNRIKGPGEGKDPDGHGTFVAGIIAGDGAGSNTIKTNPPPGSFEDPDFKGMAPEVKLHVLKYDDTNVNHHVSDRWLQTESADYHYIQSKNPKRKNTLISNNSWEYEDESDYTWAAASYDAATRDALPEEEGDQQVIYVFPAGNSGSGTDNGLNASPNTITAPGTAKNVITVGAIESLREVVAESYASVTNTVTETDEDGNEVEKEVVTTTTNTPFAGMSDSDNQVAAFSSRGNVGIGIEGAFGRFKPDLVAPGTFIISTRSADWKNTITSTNAQADADALEKQNDELGDQYRYESGTSVAAPAISGMLALMEEFYHHRLTGRNKRTNSPALMKALLINSAQSIDARYDHNVRSTVNHQGWGLPNLGRAVPALADENKTDENAWPTRFIDQALTNALATGESRSWEITLGTNAIHYPLRFTLVWTDPPGNPNAAVKLVNDLDLIVTPISDSLIDQGGPPDPVDPGDEPADTTTDTNEVYYGNNIGASVYSTMGLTNDVINNVENVFIEEPSAEKYRITVYARRVNVDSLSAFYDADTRTDHVDVVQDFALVMSSANPEVGDAFIIETDKPEEIELPAITTLTNGMPMLNQRVGANSPLAKTNDPSHTVFANRRGITNQWHFYTFTNAPPETTNQSGSTPGGPVTDEDDDNKPSFGKHVAFITFMAPNLSTPRYREADIDMYVSRDANLTNLEPAVLDAAFRSTGRGGTEYIIFDDAKVGKDEVFYIGVKSEDQMAAEFGLVGLSTDNANGFMDNGNLLMMPMPGIIPDGSAANPGGVSMFGIYTGMPYDTVRKVTATSIIHHEEVGDLWGQLSHNRDAVVLNNHTLAELVTGKPYPTDFVFIYDDELVPASVMLGSIPTDGPGSLNDFKWQPAMGVWQFDMVDSALSFTGLVEHLNVNVDAIPDLSLIGDRGIDVHLDPDESKDFLVNVPFNATNMIVQLTEMTGPVDVYIRKDNEPDIDAGPLGYHKSTLDADPAKGEWDGSPPRGELHYGLNDSPPLSEGRWFVTTKNPDSLNDVDFHLKVIFEYDISLDNTIKLVSAGPEPIDDDIVTTSLLTVTNDFLVGSVEVGVRIDHPRLADLDLHLVSPQGTRLLLSENRGHTNIAYGMTLTNATEALIVFEDGFESAENVVIDDTAKFHSGWELDSGEVYVYRSGDVAGWTADSGSKFLKMNGSEPGTISTNAVTEAGKTYRLQFAYAKSPKADEPLEMKVFVGTVTNLTITASIDGANDTLAWQTQDVEFTAKSANTRIRFQSLAPDENAVMLDTVRLDEVMPDTLYAVFSELENLAKESMKFADAPYAKEEEQVLFSGFEGAPVGLVKTDDIIDGWTVLNKKVGISQNSSAHSGNYYATLSEDISQGNQPVDDKQPGGLIWEFETGGDVRSSPAINIADTVPVFEDDFESAENDFIDNSAKFHSGWELDSGEVYVYRTGVDTPWQAHSGQQFVEMNGFEPGTISTNAVTEVDKTYRLQFAYAKNPSSDEPLRMKVNIVGVTNLTVTASVEGADNTLVWQLKDVVFVAKSSDTRVQFESLSDLDEAVMLDSVRLDEVTGSDGTIYVGSNDNNLYAFNPDGSKKWTFNTGDRVFSSPAIGSDGTIYVGSDDNSLHAINPDGTKKWEFETGGDVMSSPAIGSDGTIYVGSDDNSLHAINPDGTKKWEFETGGYVRSSPAIGSDGTIYVGSWDRNLYAINPDGTKKWEFDTISMIYSSPVVGSDGMVYVGSRGHKVYALDAKTGAKQWEFQTGANGDVMSSPAIGSDGTIYVGSHDNNLYAINPDGTKKWEFETGGNVMSSPAIGSDGTIYVGSHDNNLYAINPDGTKKWEFETGGNVMSSPAIGSDGIIYVGSDDNNLYAIEAGGSTGENKPGGSIWRDLPTAVGQDYRLSFVTQAAGDDAEYLLGGVVTNRVEGAISLTNTIPQSADPQSADWVTNTVRFTAARSSTPLTIRTESADVLLDTIVLIGPGPHNLAEEPLDVLSGERAMGEWTLEVRDHRVGGDPADTDPDIESLLVSWYIKIMGSEAEDTEVEVEGGKPYTRDDTAEALEDGKKVRGRIYDNETHYWTVETCSDSTKLTIELSSGKKKNNAKVSLLASYGGFPSGETTADDYVQVDMNDSYFAKLVIGDTGHLPLQPGELLYLTVQKTDTNVTERALYDIRATWDGDCGGGSPPNTDGAIRLANATDSESGLAKPGTPARFLWSIPAGTPAALLEASGLTADADIDLISADGLHYRNSIHLGQAPEQIVLREGDMAPSLEGDWVVQVNTVGDAPSGFTLHTTLADEQGHLVSSQPIELEIESQYWPPTVRLDWPSVPGERYVLESSENLIDWTPAHEQTAGSSGLVFHAERLWFGERYYRVKQLTGDR